MNRGTPLTSFPPALTREREEEKEAGELVFVDVSVGALGWPGLLQCVLATALSTMLRHYRAVAAWLLACLLVAESPVPATC